MLVSILRSKTRAALRDILFCNFKLVIFLGRKGLRWMKFKFASVRFFADRRPKLCQSKGKIKLERYFQKKALNVWKLLSCKEYTSFSIHLFTSDVYGPVQL